MNNRIPISFNEVIHETDAAGRLLDGREWDERPE